MNISGSGKLCGGDLNEDVRISGSGKVEGNLRCISFKCSGAGKVEGDLVCREELKVSGAMKVEGNTTAQNISVSGSFKGSGDCIAENELKISGSAATEGNIKCSSLKSSGVISTDGGIESDEVKISGVINCGGLLNAEKIDIEISSNGSKIESIGGSEIRICSDQMNKGILRLPLFKKLASNGALKVAEDIEGDIIAIENVRAKRVVGRIVAIGRGCDIDEVRYSEEIEINPDARVGTCEKEL